MQIALVLYNNFIFYSDLIHHVIHSYGTTSNTIRLLQTPQSLADVFHSQVALHNTLMHILYL